MLKWPPNLECYMNNIDQYILYTATKFIGSTADPNRIENVTNILNKTLLLSVPNIFDLVGYFWNLVQLSFVFFFYLIRGFG